MMIDYGQFCTVARGAEVIGQRWTPLVVRELLCGSTRFNDIHRGVPRISRSLLAERLRTLEEVGVVRRVTTGQAVEYRLTAAGEELRPIVMALGHWGARWIGGRLKRGQLDAGFLMWDIRRFMNAGECPEGRCIVIHFRLTDAPAGERLWWLVVSGGEVDLCREDPGQEVTLIVESTVRTLTEVWTGDRRHEDAVKARAIRVVGVPPDAEALWRWLGRSAFAETRERRPRAGARARTAGSARADGDPTGGRPLVRGAGRRG
ncbi:MAG: winged helix-turn-helix transcriptional regulator [Thermoleophilia bacterium]|nr:winged helix-turn-helix transcriptional regulator [Thermoleophilia bacterium]